MNAELDYVWASAKGIVKGLAVLPLHKNVPIAAEKDIELHELLALTDAIRIGHSREKNEAIKLLKERILINE